MTKKFSFVQKVYCHKHHIGKCNKLNPPDVIIFDDQGFPWCAEHFPDDRKANLPDIDIQKWKRESKGASR